VSGDVRQLTGAEQQQHQHDDDDPEGWVSEHLCSSVKSRDRRRSEREPDRPPPLQGTRSAGPNSRCPGGKILTAPAAPLLPGRRIGPQIGAETLLSALPVQFGNGVL